MKLVPFLTAILVMVFFFFLVVEREALFEFAGINGEDEIAASEEGASSDAQTDLSAIPPEQMVVRVVARKSIAQTIDSAVVIRGETQAAREVELRSETSGQVVSLPLRKGTFVLEDQIMCEIDKGTSEIRLAEANARLAEAKSRIPVKQKNRVSYFQLFSAKTHPGGTPMA